MLLIGSKEITVFAPTTDWAQRGEWFTQAEEPFGRLLVRTGWLDYGAAEHWSYGQRGDVFVQVVDVTTDVPTVLTTARWEMTLDGEFPFNWRQRIVKLDHERAAIVWQGDGDNVWVLPVRITQQGAVTFGAPVELGQHLTLSTQPKYGTENAAPTLDPHREDGFGAADSDTLVYYCSARYNDQPLDPPGRWTDRMAVCVISLSDLTIQTVRWSWTAISHYRSAYSGIDWGSQHGVRALGDGRVFTWISNFIQNSEDNVGYVIDTRVHPVTVEEVTAGMGGFGGVMQEVAGRYAVVAYDVGRQYVTVLSERPEDSEQVLAEPAPPVQDLYAPMGAWTWETPYAVSTRGIWLTGQYDYEAGQITIYELIFTDTLRWGRSVTIAHPMPANTHTLDGVTVTRVGARTVVVMSFELTDEPYTQREFCYVYTDGEVAPGGGRGAFLQVRGGR